MAPNDKQRRPNSSKRSKKRSPLPRGIIETVQVQSSDSLLSGELSFRVSVPLTIRAKIEIFPHCVFSISPHPTKHTKTIPIFLHSVDFTRKIKRSLFNECFSSHAEDTDAADKPVERLHKVGAGAAAAVGPRVST